jgi:hypothetical protein
MTTCPHCTNAAAVARLEEEVAQLYAALRSATKDNLEMRKRLQAWADDFLPVERLVNQTDGACGDGVRHQQAAQQPNKPKWQH